MRAGKHSGSNRDRGADVFERRFRERLTAMRDDFSKRRALVDGASVCEDALALFEDYLEARDQVLLTPTEAGEISGYNPEHLTRLVRQGKIPDLRPAGSKGSILIRLSELPRKPGHPQANMSDVNQIAERMFRSKKRR